MMGLPKLNTPARELILKSLRNFKVSFTVGYYVTLYEGLGPDGDPLS
jgi:hypothetical protein